MMQVKKKKTKALAGGKKQKRGPGKVKDGQRQADEVQFVEAPYSYYDGYRHCPHSHRVTFIKGKLKCHTHMLLAISAIEVIRQ